MKAVPQKEPKDDLGLLKDLDPQGLPELPEKHELLSFLNLLSNLPILSSREAMTLSCLSTNNCMFLNSPINSTNLLIA